MGYERVAFPQTMPLEKINQTSIKPIISNRNPIQTHLLLQRKIDNQTVKHLIQTKMNINQPGDVYEQEADRVANQVMRMPDSHLQRKCTACEEQEKFLQAKEQPGQTPEVSPSQEGNLRAIRGGGSPMPASVRAFFEPRFGYNFSNVHIHTDGQAAKVARSVNARAFAMGNNIVFGQGEYSPGTTEGRKLLAHELVHTIQQSRSSGTDGNSTPYLQRTIGDGHDLTAGRFAKDPVLEAVYDNERVLKKNDRGTAVKKLQSSLIAAGFPLPRYGDDGSFGAETEVAVREFQRSSGLNGVDRDGIVGSITMGWLDQRFSIGPTPAGTKPGSTPGCAALKTINVDIVSLDGSNRDPLADLDVANTIFNQACVRFVLGSGGSMTPVQTRNLLGGDTDLETGTCGSPTAEETALYKGAKAKFGLSSRFRVFYIASISSGARADSYPPYCAVGAASGLRNMVSITNTVASRSLAHEFGHILLNSGDHPSDTNNIMNPTNTATGDQLTPAQRAIIFGNA